MKPKDTGKSKNKAAPKAGSGWTGTKIAIVVIGVLFVVLMVVSSLGSGWLSYFSSTKTGDTATFSYTIRDDIGRPVITTDVNVFNQSTRNGDVVFFAKTMDLPINITTQKNLTEIPVVIDNSGQIYQFGLFRDEMNALATGLAGVKSGQSRTISLAMPNEPLENTLTIDQFQNLTQGTHKNASDYRVNDQLVLAYSENPIINLDKNTPPPGQFFRTFYIENISTDGVVIKGGYKAIDVTVLSVKTQ